MNAQPATRLQHNSATYLKTYTGDPLAVLCVDRLRLSPGLAAVLILILALIIDGLSALLVRQPIPALHGWTDDWTYALYTYGIAPLVAAAYVWVAVASGKLFFNLRRSEALLADEADFDDFVHGPLQSRHMQRGWTLASLLVVLLLAVVYLRPAGYSAQWTTTALILRVVKVVLLYVPVWYMICQVVAREAVTIWGLGQLFRRFAIEPHPLHPDRCGGLRAINDYVVGFTTIIALMGVGVVILITASWVQDGSTLSWMNAAILVAYGVLGLVFFFLPPWTAHTSMVRAKEQMLTTIARRFQADYAELLADLQNENREWDKPMERTQDLHALYQLVEAFPIWPFDSRTLRRFVAVLVIPTLPIVIEVISELISNALVR